MQRQRKEAESRISCFSACSIPAEKICCRFLADIEASDQRHPQSSYSMFSKTDRRYPA
uniref:Uncharacterized protein n=1 Tax=Faecalibaculum rodentium TaxID=1702221 RepID=A0A140DWB0_9FIRM|nr:hypothetical protein AALO17_18030 [Faecalibaculum rodentium]